MASEPRIFAARIGKPLRRIRVEPKPIEKEPGKEPERQPERETEKPKRREKVPA